MVVKLIKLITSYYTGLVAGWFAIFILLAVIGALLTACTFI
jgi:hypothetical protein